MVLCCLKKKWIGIVLFLQRKKWMSVGFVLENSKNLTWRGFV